MSDRTEEILKNLNAQLRDVPGNPSSGRRVNRPEREDVLEDTNTPPPPQEYNKAPEVRERQVPSMAQARQVGTEPSLSIAQMIVRFTEDTARFVEQEAARRLAAEQAYHEKMTQFAASIRRVGAGGL